MGKLRLQDGPELVVDDWNDIGGPKGYIDRLTPFQNEVALVLQAMGADRPDGWIPGFYQYLVLTSKERFTVACAGRRGGKTFSAAWRAALSAWPKTQREFLRKRGVDVPPEGRVILGAIVVPNTTAFPDAENEFVSCLRALGMEEGKDYTRNRTTKRYYFPNDRDPISEVRVKGALDPDSMRGGGYSWAWWDEAGAIKGQDTWDTFLPALGDRNGCCDFTLTPGVTASQWWVYDLFIKDGDPEAEVIQWKSMESAHLKFSMIQRAKASMHPLKFRREWEAVWEKGGEQDLNPDWLTKHAYDDNELIRGSNGQLDRSRYRLFYGVDPAISMSDRADDFSRTGLAVDQITGQGYMLDAWTGKIDAPEQVRHLESLHIAEQPDAVGIESNAYQASLAQHVRSGTTMIQVLEIRAKGDKASRIRSMSVGFATGTVRVPKSWCRAGHPNKFYDQWVEFPDAPHDDSLDSAEIAIRAADYLGANPMAAGTGGEQKEEDPRERLLEKMDKDLEDSAELAHAGNEYYNW